MAEIASKWIPVHYQAIPICVSNNVINDKLFFVMEYNNNWGVNYGDFRNNIPLRFNIFQTDLTDAYPFSIKRADISVENGSIPEYKKSVDDYNDIKISSTGSPLLTCGNFNFYRKYNILSPLFDGVDSITLSNIEYRVVKLNFSFDIQFNNSEIYVENDSIDIIIHLDVPVPKCSILVTPGSGFSKCNVKIFSDVPCYRFAMSCTKEKGERSWQIYQSDTPKTSYIFADITALSDYYISYDCYAYTTSLKSTTVEDVSVNELLNRTIYISDLSSDTINSISVYAINGFSNALELCCKLTDDDYRSMALNNKVGNITYQGLTPREYDVNVALRQNNMIDRESPKQRIDVRGLRPSESIDYLGIIVDQPDTLGSTSKTTCVQCKLDRACYIDNMYPSHIGHCRTWKWRQSGYGFKNENPAITNLQYNAWLNTYTQFNTQCIRSTEYCVNIADSTETMSGNFYLDSRQPDIIIDELSSRGTTVYVSAHAQYITDTGTLNPDCYNWQYAFIASNKLTPNTGCIKQSNYRNGVIKSYFATECTKDVVWNNVPEVSNASSISFNVSELEANTEYFIVVRAVRLLNNIACNILSQFNSNLTPKYKIKTTGGVPIYIDNSWKIGLPYIRIVPDKNIQGNEDKEPYWAPATTYIYTKNNNKWNPIIWDGTIPPAEKISADASPQVVILDDSNEAAAKDAHSASADTFINIDSISDVSSKGVKSIESENSVDIITQTIAFSRLKAGIESSINIPMVSNADIYSRAVKEVAYKTALILSYTIDSKSTDAKQLEQAAYSKTLELFDTSSLSSASAEHSESTDNSICIDDTAEGTNCDGNHLTSYIDTNILSDAESITISDLTYTSGNIDIPIETNSDIVADDSSQADSSDIFDIDAKCEVMVIQGGYSAPEIDGNDLKIKSVMTISQEDDILTLE